MRKLLLLSLLLTTMLSVWGSKKVEFTITGKTSTMSREIEIRNFATGKTVGTVMAKNGTFVYKGNEYTDKYLEFLDVTSRKVNLVIIDGSDITLDMNRDAVSGSPLNEELYAVARKAAELHKAKKNSEARSYLLERIEANKDNCAPVYWIYRYYHILGHEDVKALMNSGRDYTKHPARVHIDNIMERVEKEKALLGTDAKDFKIPDMRGEKHRISEFLGKGNYVLIDYWASWCGPCVKEIPNIKTNYERYHSKGFDVIGISLDKDKAKCISALGRYNIPWKNFCDYEGWESIAAAVYDIHTIPFNILCDGNGKIVAVNLRGKALGRKLKEIYGE